MRLFCLLILIVGSIGYSSTFYVAPATRKGVTAQRADLVTDLVKRGVRSLSGARLTNRIRKARFTLLPKAIRLGSLQLIQLDKVRNKKLIFSSEVKVKKIEHLASAIRTLTKNVVLEREGSERYLANKDDDRWEVEQAPPEEKQTYQPDQEVFQHTGYGFGFGPASLGKLNAKGLGYYFYGSYIWDVSDIVIRARADIVIDGGALMADLGLGANYFFYPSRLWPFIGAEFGFGFGRVDNGSLIDSEKVAGFSVGIVTGIYLLRSDTINFEVSLRGAMILKKSSQGHPAMAGGRVSLYF